MSNTLGKKEKKILDYLASGKKLTNYEAVLMFAYTDLRSFRSRFNKYHTDQKIVSEKVENSTHHVYSLQAAA